MKTIQIIRNGQPTKRFQVAERAEGLFVGFQPLLNADRLAELGISPTAAAKIIKSGKYDKVLPAMLRMGDNGSGCVVVDAEEWDRQQLAGERAVREASARRLAELFPGLDELRVARAGEEANRDAFRRMMESGSGRMEQPYKGAPAAELAQQHPAAALYLRAESWTCAANDSKSAAGRRALAKMEAGASAVAAAADMEAEWSAAAQAAVENS
jgi:hypothetical protein